MQKHDYVFFMLCFSVINLCGFWILYSNNRAITKVINHIEQCEGCNNHKVKK